MRAKEVNGAAGDSPRPCIGQIVRRPVWIIFLLALAIRLVPYGFLASTPRRFNYGIDSLEYDRLAQNLVAQQRFSLTTTPPYTPDVSRTPVFPLFLAGIYTLVGHSIPTAIFVNILVGCLVCLLAYVLGREMFGMAAGTFAGLALAFDVNSVMYANQLLTETLFTLLLALGVLYLWKYVSRARLRDAAISGTLLSAAALARPIGVFLFVFLAPVFLAVALHRTSTRLVLRDYAVFSVCATLLVVAWIARNYAVAGITDLTSVVAVNAYYHRAAAMLAKKEGIPVEAMRERMQVVFDHEFPPDETSLAQRLKVMKQRARMIIGANVGLYLRTHLEGIARMVGAEDLGIMSSAQGGHHYQGPVPPGLRNPIVRLTKNVTQIFVFVLALIGAGSAYRRRMFAPLFLLLSVIGYFYVLSGPEAYGRFQVPVMPFLCILSGIGVARLWDRFGPSYSAWGTCG